MISGSGENFLMITLQSTIIGNWLHENAPMGRGTLGRKIRIPISNDCARLSICCRLQESIGSKVP